MKIFKTLTLLIMMSLTGFVCGSNSVVKAHAEIAQNLDKTPRESQFYTLAFSLLDEVPNSYLAARDALAIQHACQMEKHLSQLIKQSEETNQLLKTMLRRSKG